MKWKIIYWWPPDYIEYVFEEEISDDTISIIDTLRNKFNMPINYELE